MTPYDINPYSQVENTIHIPHSYVYKFDNDLKVFFDRYDLYGLEGIEGDLSGWSSYFSYLVLPMLQTLLVHKRDGAKEALEFTQYIQADDWRIACEHWLEKRIK